MIDKKTLPIIVILVILILFYFQILEYLGLYTPPKPQQQTQQETAQQVPSPDTSITPPPPPEQREEPKVAAIEADSTEKTPDTVVIQTNTFTALLTSHGGGLLSLKLKKYTYRDGKQIEMLPLAEHATPDATFANGTFSTTAVDFSADLAPGTYHVQNGSQVITYHYTAPSGGEIIKKYTFYPDSYHFDLELEVREPIKLGFERQYNLVWNTPLGVTEPQAEMDYNAMEAVAMMSGSREKLDDFQDNKLNQSLTGYTTWAGVRSKYFAAVLIPRNRMADGVFAQGEKEKISTPDGTIEQRRITVGINMPFANINTVADTFRVFVGPLDYTLLSKYNVGLEDMLGIGTTPIVGWLIKPFAVAIIWLLPRMYEVIPNYGLVIILFAFFVKVVTLPLSLKSYKSMNAMKELQPKMEELKKKHKNNPQALNAEMMKLYKAHGVNPMSGCLPMLPQMPLFFALFSVFRSTILLRNAPFVGFITDLSRGATSFTDPYIILVAVMIISQFISQRFTMASTSQQNKMLMYFFPLFMGWLLYKFPAGLVLYWTCFSIFSLFDYLIFRRRKSTGSPQEGLVVKS